MKTINPNTNRSITVNGGVFKTVLSEGRFRYDQDLNKFIPIGVSNAVNNPHSGVAVINVDDDITMKEVTALMVASKTTKKELEFNLQPHSLSVNNNILEKTIDGGDDYRLTHLFHISDIHIPLNISKEHRIDEFLTVFNRLYEALKRRSKVIQPILMELLSREICFIPK